MPFFMVFNIVEQGMSKFLRASLRHNPKKAKENVLNIFLGVLQIIFIIIFF